MANKTCVPHIFPLYLPVSDTTREIHRKYRRLAPITKYNITSKLCLLGTYNHKRWQQSSRLIVTYFIATRKTTCSFALGTIQKRLVLVKCRDFNTERDVLFTIYFQVRHPIRPFHFRKIYWKILRFMAFNSIQILPICRRIKLLNMPLL